MVASLEPLETLITLPPASFSERLVASLADTGYAIFPGLIRPEIAEEVRGEMDALREADGFRPASIGKGNAKQIVPETRGDVTAWIEPRELSAVQEKLIGVFSPTREELNAGLYLGLWDWEGHYAIYPPGTFYRKHLDRFAADSRRTVSIVFFFNPDWVASDGGALRLETPDGSLDVLPESGTAVFFLSDRIPHEVVETKRDRYSFAGWFRTRP
jgi:SM-20-related protein